MNPSLPLTPLIRPQSKYMDMLKGGMLVGKPVLTVSHLTPIATIEDLIFDYASNQILAFALEQPAWKDTTHIIPWSGVQAVRPEAIVVWSANMMVVAGHLYRIKQVLERELFTKGMSIFTFDGRYLGLMTDLYFNEQTGAVKGYEVQGGLSASSETDRGFVPAPSLLRVSRNAAYVPSQTLRFMEERSYNLNQLHYQGQQSLGRRVRIPVYMDSGSLIAAVGQIVTPPMLELARLNGLESALLRATGLSSND